MRVFRLMNVKAELGRSDESSSGNSASCNATSDDGYLSDASEASRWQCGSECGSQGYEYWGWSECSDGEEMTLKRPYTWHVDHAGKHGGAGWKRQKTDWHRTDKMFNSNAYRGGAIIREVEESDEDIFDLPSPRLGQKHEGWMRNPFCNRSDKRRCTGEGNYLDV